MTWRLRVRHLTRYLYQGTVTNSYNEARMTPLSVPGQTTIDARLEIRPAVRAFRYWDYWGTMVHAFDVHQPHDELTVAASAVVETSSPLPCTEVTTWEELAREEQRDRFCELLNPSEYVPADEALTQQAVSLRAGGSRDPKATALAANAFVHDHMTYRTGSTTVATSAPEAFAAGNGVCQDFAHIMLGILRAIGIPSRYVSGYLYPDTEAGLGQVHAGQSHAWIEAWVGDWLALDPTHGGFIGPQHVLVARGRDYADVTPLKGIFTGAPVKSLDVNVELTRIA
ncbi:MAG: transglutaminase family protein [Actinomycetota bacterium]|nr:transglutaminase family protein [Actinomycetota bacterium]MDQ6945908.1 transglutaminase family protein [Actinomycetota bacterium]